MSVAVALTDDGLTHDGFSRSQLDDPAIRSLAARVVVHHDPALDPEYPAGRPTVVEIAQRDGTRLSRKGLYPRGDCTNPITREEVRSKARALLGHRFDDEGTDRVIMAVERLPDAGSLAELSAALRGAAEAGTVR
jgi:2-methylcitrate dehydratase PrpD